MSKQEEIARAFRLFDADGNGTLSEEEVVRILAHPGGDAPFTEAEARRIVKKFDTNGDGVLDYKEYTGAHKEIRKHSTVGRAPVPAPTAEEAVRPPMERKKSTKPKNCTKEQQNRKNKVLRERQLAREREAKAQKLHAEIEEWFGHADFNVRTCRV